MQSQGRRPHPRVEIPLYISQYAGRCMPASPLLILSRKDACLPFCMPCTAYALQRLLCEEVDLAFWKQAVGELRVKHGSGSTRL